MVRRRLLFALILTVGWQLAISCRPAIDIVILSPVVDVTTFSFTVSFEISGSSYDTSTASATLNGEPMILSGGPSVFTATIEMATSTVNAGFPLKDDNILRVSAPKPGASPFASRTAWRASRSSDRECATSTAWASSAETSSTPPWWGSPASIASSSCSRR